MKRIYANSRINWALLTLAWNKHEQFKIQNWIEQIRQNINEIICLDERIKYWIEKADGQSSVYNYNKEE